jgi:hypothetical protein
MSDYIHQLDAEICGIPCIIGVTTYERVQGSFSYNAPSDMDYHGYEEIEFDVLNRRGRPAPYLERRMTDDERESIEDDIRTHFKEELENY